MSNVSDQGYNDRLFGSDFLRRAYHNSRFNWTAKKLRTLADGSFSLVELGCFDGRLLDHLSPPPTEYVGVDANWEGGLELAQARYSADPSRTFLQTEDPAVFSRFPEGKFNCSVSLETLEHLPPQAVAGFVAELARITRGHFIATVPNEMGPLFLIKHVGKRIRYGRAEQYTWRELWAASLRQSGKVERDQHKGFDYRNMVAEIREHFDIISVEGVPAIGVPAWLSPTVGIVAKSRTAR